MAHTPHVAQVTDVAHTPGLKARWLQTFLGWRPDALIQNTPLYVVGAVLSNSADWEGTCIRPVTKLAKAAGYSARTVHKRLKLLVSFGMIELVRQGGYGPGNTSVYKLCEPNRWWRGPYLPLSIGHVPPHGQLTR